MVVEIIAGVIVLILAIIGIAKLVRGKGGGGGSGSENIMEMTKNSINRLEYALEKDPENLRIALQYVQFLAGRTRGPATALSKRLRVYREKVDVVAARQAQPIEDELAAYSSIQDMNRFVAKAIRKYRRGEIKTPEQFMNYLRKKVGIEKEELKLNYEMGHAGFA